MKPHPDEKWHAIRTTLLARAAELRDRLQRVRSDLGRQREPLPRDCDDAAIVRENDEVLEAIESTAARELGLIDAALQRIGQGVFGLCVRCAGEIDARRLQVVPYASHCRECSPGD